MKTYKFLAIGIAMLSIFSLASCQKDNGPDKPKEGEPTMATFVLDQSAPKTYAETEEAEGAEKTVKSATVYVFAERVLTHIVPFEANASSKTVQLTTGTKQFFACVNMNTVLADKNISVGMTLDNFKKRLFTGMKSKMTDATSSSGGYWMTNTEADAPEVNVQKATEAEVANGSNNFTINVGRVVSKLKLTKSLDCEEVGGALSSIKYTICNIPQSIYLMPVFNGPNYTGTHLVTPFSNSTWVASNPQTGQVDATSYFEYPSTAEVLGSSTFMLENASEAVSSMQVTYLLVEGVWTPTGANTGSSFWRVAVYDKVATQSDAKLQHYEAGTYKTQQEANLAIKGDNTKKAVEFIGGKCYYRIALQDLSTVPDVAAADPVVKYTIRRNSSFKVDISKIAGPGTSEPGEVVDPDQPVEAESWMKATVTILPWAVVNQDAQI